MRELIKLNEQRCRRVRPAVAPVPRGGGPAPSRRAAQHALPAKTGNENVDEGYRLLATYLSNTWDNSVHRPRHRLRARVHRTRHRRVLGRLPVPNRLYTSEEAPAHAGSTRRGAGHLPQRRPRQTGTHGKRARITLHSSWSSRQIRQPTRTVEALRKRLQDEAVALLTTQKNFLEDHPAAWAPP